MKDFLANAFNATLLGFFIGVGYMVSQAVASLIAVLVFFG